MPSVSHRDNDGDLAILQGFLSGVGSPLGVVRADIGAMYRRIDGDVGSTFYFKETDSGEATGWTAYVGGATFQADLDTFEAAVAALDVRTTAAEADITALETTSDDHETRVTDLESFADAQVTTNAAQVTVNGNLSAAIAAVASDLITSSASLDGRLDAVEADDWVTTARINARAVTFAELQTISTARFLGRTTASAGSVEELTASAAKTLLAIGASDVSGLATVATSGSAADLGTGTLPAGRLPALTGDVTTSAGSAATTIASKAVTLPKMADMASDRLLGRDTAGVGAVESIDLGVSLEFSGSGSIQRAALTGDVTASANGNATTIANNAVTTAKVIDDAVTNAKLANVATATFKGRTTAGTGDPEDLTATQATALLNLATTSVKGLAPVLSNNTAQFLRGDGSYAGPLIPYHFGGLVMTAGDQNKFANPVGISTSPIGSVGNRYAAPFAMELVAITYSAVTAHTTNTVTVTPRIAGVEQTTHTMTVSAGSVFQHLVFSGSPAPYALAAGDVFVPQMDHNGATNLAGLQVTFWMRAT